MAELLDAEAVEDLDLIAAHQIDPELEPLGP